MRSFVRLRSIDIVLAHVGSMIMHEPDIYTFGVRIQFTIAITQLLATGSLFIHPKKEKKTGRGRWILHAL
jgi:hypothetical protein